jgi:sporulation protein YlmC with PRC-barrel domain
MLQRLLLTTAIAAFALTPALAQDSSTGAQSQTPTVQTPPPPEPTAQADTGQPPADVATEEPPATPPSADVAAEEPPATPPPAEAIIASEGATDMRADKLIGTSVYNTEGQEVGSVEDIVFDQEGKIVGVVLKVGGMLGIGGKSVGIKWNEVQVSPTEEVMTIMYSQDQLEVAPDFKTKDSLQAEQQTESMSQPSAPPAQPQQ